MSVLNQNYPFNFVRLNFNTGLYFLLFIFFLSLAKKNLQLILTGVVYTVSLLQLLNFQYFSAYILPISFYQLFNQFGEIMESFLGEINKMILPVPLVLAFALVTKVVVNKYNTQMKKVTTPWIISVLLSLFVSDLYHFHQILSSSKDRLWQFQAQELMPMPNNLAITNAYRALKYFILGIAPKKIYGNENDFPVLASPKINNKPDINIIFVIGESLRAEQLSILGYKGQTTPLLQKTVNLHASTVYASGTMTKSAIAALINRLKYPGNTIQIASQNNCLFKLAKQNSFKTHFISAQTPEQLAIINNLICKNNIDHYSARPENNTQGSLYELTVIEKLDNINFDDNNFIVLHQRGSHSPYDKRSPKEFKKFDSEYDNSVLFTDYVLNKLIKKVNSQSNKTTYIIYTSDHGELLSGEGLSGHGWFEKQVYEVPFLFYLHNPLNEVLNYDEEIPYVLSHFDISTLITQLLGYQVTIDKNPSREIYINGSDVDGLAGYMQLTINNKSMTNSQVFR